MMPSGSRRYSADPPAFAPVSTSTGGLKNESMPAAAQPFVDGQEIVDDQAEMRRADRARLDFRTCGSGTTYSNSSRRWSEPGSFMSAIRTWASG